MLEILVNFEDEISDFFTVHRDDCMTKGSYAFAFISIFNVCEWHSVNTQCSADDSSL